MAYLTDMADGAFSNMTPHARTDIRVDYGQLTRIVRATSRCPHFSLAIISITVQLWAYVFGVVSVYFNIRNTLPK